MGGIVAFSDSAPGDSADQARGPDRHAEAESLNRLAAIVESSEDAIVGKDLDGIITSWNPAAERLYGYTAQEAIGQPISILVPPENHGELGAILDRLRGGERIRHHETERIRKDGTRVEVSVTISPIRDAHGQIVGAAAIGREITSHRRTERERQDLLTRERVAREQLEAILGGIADGVIVQREDGKVIYANDAAARIAGFTTAEEYLRATTFEISRRLTALDADGQPFPYEQLPAHRAFRGEDATEMVVQFRRADSGEPRWSRTQARLVHGGDGRPLAISIFHDITEEMRSRDRLRFLGEAGAKIAGSLDVDETLNALVGVASTTLADWAVVILVDEAGAVEHIASAHRDPAKEPLTRELHDAQLRHASGAALLWQTIQTGEAMLVPEVTDEMMAQTARSEEHLAMLRALRLSSLLYAPLTGRGRVQGAIALFMAGSGRRFADEDRAIAVEIARRASLAVENARLYREAREAVQARDEFLSIASHELRTPVTAISGVAQVAMRSRQRGTLDDARLDRVLEQLLRGSQRLVALTEDLLDVSRLQTGRFELRPEPVDLQAFVADFAERFSANLGESHRLVLETGNEESKPANSSLSPSPSPLIVAADPARLEQVLANLLSNAAKYSPTGGTITVIVTHDAASAQVCVRDEGIGWPPGTEEAIFEPFGRAPNASHRQIQGLGLGLYICRQIVERHGGRIRATSPGEGAGATFCFWLPTEETGEEPANSR
jgi:PAS domain S-box-containing protein